MASNTVFELVQRESGLWAILKRTGSTAIVTDTGHLDREIAAQDLACFAKSKTLSPTGQGWLKVADRLARNVKQGRHQDRNSRDHDVINRQDMLRLLMKQGYRCPISGSYFTHDAFDGENRGPYQPSVDRIDCSRGYVRGNLRIVCLLVNVALSTWGEEPLRKIARRIVTHGLRPVPVSSQNVGRSRLRLTSCEILPFGENSTPAPADAPVSHSQYAEVLGDNKQGENP